MSAKQHFTTEQAREFGDKFGTDWDWNRPDVEQSPMGLGIKLKHGRHDSSTDLTGSNANITDKIARAYLNEFADYDTREKMKREER